MKLYLLLIFPAIVLSRELITCYSIYFLFLPVAESCVTYRYEGSKLLIRSWVKTVVVGRIVKRVNSWGEAEIIGFKPLTFELFQREGDFKRDHRYVFDERGVLYRIVKYGREGRKVEEGFLSSSIILVDPFTASFMVYTDTPNFVKSTIPLFYDAKVQHIDYRTVGEEKVEIFGKIYDTWKVVLIPRIETRGVLKPKGRWILWVDKRTLIPVRLKIGFTVGSVHVYLKKVKGDERLLPDLKRARIY
ncbi:MAG: DUF3108 domain-containing protein [Aquificota bacterium]|nr:DUF3108 domain-containing protein [Aquificota bacterium]